MALPNRKEVFIWNTNCALLPNKIRPRLRAKQLSQRAAERLFEKYARKVIDRARFIILNKIGELDGTNERLLKYYRENIEKHPKV